MASSGLPVTYKVTGPATLSGNVVILTGAGTVGVGAYQTGSAFYNAAPVAHLSFTVSKVTQTITFPAIGEHQVGDVFPLTVTASSGLPVTLSIASGPATLSGSTVTVTAKGTVKIKAVQAGDTSFAAAPSLLVGFSVSP